MTHSKIYIRPLGLCFGQDARSLISQKRAGALGGLPYAAFTLAEVITRGSGTVSRSIVSFDDVRGAPAIKNIVAARPSFAGIDLTTTRVMGIVNVTPDSFSDGGKFASADQAIEQGRVLFQQGADIVDVGGESTRPGSNAVDVPDEIKRIEPVIRELSGFGPVSADTRKAAVIRAAATAGARAINDVSALTHDPDAAAAVAAAGLPVIIMHAQGEPKTMQLNPRYDDVALDVYDYLEGRIAALSAHGIPHSQIMVDPGIGFGKTYRHNIELTSQLALFHGLGVGVMMGLSRKSIVGALTGEKVAANRAAGSVGGALQASLLGAHMLRVHDVKFTIDALRMLWGAMDPDSTEV